MPKNRSLPPDTDRLAFRTWNDDDSVQFHAICSDPQVMQHVGDGRVWLRERTGQFIQAALETSRSHGYCQWPLINKADGTLIGYCGFVNTGDLPEIGWRLTPGYWGQGLATEAAHAVVKHGTETMGFQRVIASVQSANVASVRVIEKLGMTLVKRSRRHGREILLYMLDRTSLV